MPKYKTVQEAIAAAFTTCYLDVLSRVKYGPDGVPAGTGPDDAVQFPPTHDGATVLKYARAKGMFILGALGSSVDPKELQRRKDRLPAVQNELAGKVDPDVIEVEFLTGRDSAWQDPDAEGFGGQGGRFTYAIQNYGDDGNGALLTLQGDVNRAWATTGKGGPSGPDSTIPGEPVAPPETKTSKTSKSK